MADEEKDVKQEESSEGAKATPQGSPIKKYMIMAGIILVTAAAGYFVTLKFVKPMVAGEETAESTDGEYEDDESSAKDDADKPKKEKKKKKKTDENGEELIEAHIFEVEDVIVNPAGTGGTRFLSVSVGFEVEYAETIKLFETRQPQIRDALITILGSKNIEQLTDMKQKEIARLQIKKRVESLLDTDELSAIYFTDFVIQ